jgi:hypothetical protein
MLSDAMLSVLLLIVIILSAMTPKVRYANCYFAISPYANCYYAKLLLF